MEVIVGLIINVVPIFSKVPPQDSEYQYHEAEVPRLPPVNDNVDELPKHISDGFEIAVEGSEEIAQTPTKTLPQTEYAFPSSCLT